jgi:hypothetical protein
MKKPVRKISLIRLSQLPWTGCSVAHKGVRKWTYAGGLTKRAVALELKNQMNLQGYAPLATRMLIPHMWIAVPSPSN